MHLKITKQNWSDVSGHPNHLHGVLKGAVTFNETEGNGSFYFSLPQDSIELRGLDISPSYYPDLTIEVPTYAKMITIWHPHFIIISVLIFA